MYNGRKIISGRNYPFSLLLIFFLTTLISCNNKSGDRQQESSQQQPLRVSAVVVSEATLEQPLQAAGTVLADEEIEVKSEISGRITGILFTEGGSVNAGQVMVRLNDQEIRAELQKAEYEKALLEDKEARHRELLKIQAVSREEYDNSLKALNVSKAHITLLEAQLEKTELRAPFSGVAGLRMVSEGAAITPSTVITSLQKINPLKLEFSVPERYSGDIVHGSRLSFSIEGLDSLLSAEVYAIEPRIDPISRTLRMRAIFSNPRGRVLPGAFANIRYTPNGSKLSLMIPSQALIPDAQGAQVLVLKEGKAAYKRVETAYRTQTHVEIIAGLQSGDTVLTGGIQQVRPGMKVQPLINP